MVRKIEHSDFERYVYKSKKKVILVYFFTPHDKKCHYYEESDFLSVLSRKYTMTLDIFRVNADEEQQLAKSGNVTGVPTMFLFVPGNHVPVNVLRGNFSPNDVELMVSSEIFKILSDIEIASQRQMN